MTNRGFNVVMRTTGREVYYVIAGSAKEASDGWMEGELIVSEVLDSEVESVSEEAS